MPAADTVRSLFDAFARRDADAALPLLDPDVELLAQPTGELAGRTEPYVGHDGFREYLADVDRVWERFSVDPGELRVAGNGVIAFGSASGRPRGAAADVRVPVIWVFRVRDGLVVSCRVARTAVEAEGLVA